MRRWRIIDNAPGERASAGKKGGRKKRGRISAEVLRETGQDSIKR